MKGEERGFLLVEVLIAVIIVSGALIACFSLFKMGYDLLRRAEESNRLSSKIPQIIAYLSEIADLEKGEGELSFGDETKAKWKATLLETKRSSGILTEALEEGHGTPLFEVYLYLVEVSLESAHSGREFKLKVFRYKSLVPQTTES